MGLSSALATAMAGLRSTQASLSIISSNVANAQTPGYVAQNPNQVEVASGNYGSTVATNGVNRQLDLFVQNQLRTETAGGGYAMAWVSVWDTPADGAEFMSAIDDVMLKRFNVKPSVSGELRHFDAGKRVVEVNVREVEGRPVVLYVDVPAGTSTNIIDFSKVKVTPR